MFQQSPLMDAFLANAGGGTTRKTTVDDGGAASARGNEGLPWVEKYRPRKVDDLVFQDEVVAVLKKVLQGADLPNLLFYGPPGTGKTSAAIALCRQLFGPEGYRTRVLEMNASDERGINVVRTKIKDFARLAVSSFSQEGKPCPPLKVIILDEADAMTSAAQAALRRTMETQSKTTRFFLICNYISRIIDPLTSRCAKFRFKALSEESQRTRLLSICANESVRIDDDAIGAMIAVCEGDLRKSITYLQAISSAYRGSANAITAEQVLAMSGAVPEAVIADFLSSCESRQFDQVQLAVESVKRLGYGGYQLMRHLFDVLLTTGTFRDEAMAVIFEKMALCEYRLLDGADEFLQLFDLGCTILEQFERI